MNRLNHLISFLSVKTKILSVLFHSYLIIYLGTTFSLYLSSFHRTMRNRNLYCICKRHCCFQLFWLLMLFLKSKMSCLRFVFMPSKILLLFLLIRQAHLLGFCLTSKMRDLREKSLQTDFKTQQYYLLNQKFCYRIAFV